MFLDALEWRLKFEKRDVLAVREKFKEIKRKANEKPLDEIKYLF